jgi:hypothetical protein
VFDILCLVFRKKGHINVKYHNEISLSEIRRSCAKHTEAISYGRVLLTLRKTVAPFLSDLKKKNKKRREK